MTKPGGAGEQYMLRALVIGVVVGLVFLVLTHVFALFALSTGAGLCVGLALSMPNRWDR
jgi:hypothetical protein